MPRTHPTRRSNPVASPLPPRAHALTLLRADHDEVRQLSRAYEKLIKLGAPAARRLRAALVICRKLSVHARIEEEIFYPAVREKLPRELPLDHAEVEHDVAKYLVHRIKRCKGNEAHLDALVGVLCEYVAHHVAEEHREIFPKARKAKIDLHELGARMARRQASLSR